MTARVSPSGRGAVLNFKLPAAIEGDANVRSGVYGLLSSVRTFRIPLAMWNVFICFLMIIWFP